MKNPKYLFLIDGLGALVSAFLLGVVLVYFENFFGIPKNTLYILAFLPCLFACYDLFCFLKKDLDIAKYLKGIAILNFSYCFLSIGFAFYHLYQLTIFGWTYLILEIVVVSFIAWLEYRTAVGLGESKK